MPEDKDNKPIPVRFNKKEREELERVKEFFNIPKNRWGATPEAIKKSIKSVLEMKESMQYAWEDFLRRYPLPTREYIKKRLNE